MSKSPSPVVQTNSKLSIVLLHPSRRSDIPSVLIEGTRRSLQQLAKLIAEVAKADDCGRQLSPRGPGSDWFTEYSEMGLYIHRLPCANWEVGEKGMTVAEIAGKNARRAKRARRNQAT